jgi:hypothetical protein
MLRGRRRRGKVGGVALPGQAAIRGATNRPCRPSGRRNNKRIKVFWFFFSKKNKCFFLKKEAKTFARSCRLAGRQPTRPG